METVGYEKREMLVDRLQEARTDQVEAKQQLQTALYTLTRLGSAPATEMPDLRDDLDKQVGDAENELEDLRSSIAAVESVSGSMFDEWEEELAKYDSDELRNRSKAELQESRKEYSTLITQLKQTEQKLTQLIPPLQDQVLYLEHAVNAGDRVEKPEGLDDVREQISTAIEDLETSIDRTNRFIEEGIEVSA
jgi:chromosome segregation ATPase